MKKTIFKNLAAMSAAVVASVMLCASVGATEYKITAANFADGNFEATTESGKRFLTIYNENEGGSVEMTFTTAQKEIYDMEIIGGLHYEEDSNAEYWSKMSYSIDGGKKQTISSENTDRTAQLDYGWWGTNFAQYKAKERIILSAGEHTVTFWCDEPCAYDGSYINAIESVKFSGSEITANFSFDGWGDDFLLDSNSGNPVGVIMKKVDQTYTRTVNFYVGEEGYYDYSFSALFKFDNASNYVSPMYYNIDGGDDTLISSKNVYATGKQYSGWASLGTVQEYEMNKPVYLEKGDHSFSLIVKEDNGKNSQWVAAIAYINIGMARNRDITGASGNFTCYSAGNYSLDVNTKAVSLPVTVTLNGTDYEFTEENCFAVKTDSGYRIRLNKKVPLLMGENTVSTSAGSVDFRYVRNITAVKADTDTVIKEGKTGKLALVDGNGNKLTADDVFSCKFTSGDTSVATVSDFGEISTSRGGRSDIAVEIVPDGGADAIKLTVPVWSVRGSGCYVKDAKISGNSVNVTLGGTVSDAAYIFAGVREKSTLSGFDEAKVVNKTVGTISFEEISADDEVVIFIMDENFRHLYAKTVAEAE